MDIPTYYPEVIVKQGWQYIELYNHFTQTVPTEEYEVEVPMVASANQNAPLWPRTMISPIRALHN